MEKQELKQAFGAKVSDLQHRYEDRIREHPFRSAAIALGVGAATGIVAVALMNHRHRAS